MARSDSLPFRQVRQASALVMAADGVANGAIARAVGGEGRHGAGVAGSVRRGRCRGGGSGASGAGAQAGDSRWGCRGDRGGHVGGAPRGWCDALVDAGHGGAPRCRQGHGGASVEGAGVASVAGGDIQVVQRPAVRGQARRCRRVVPGPAAVRGGVVRGREVPVPGPGAVPTVAADDAGSRRHDDPRLQAPRHDDAVRRAERRDRRGSHRLPAPAPPPGVPGIPETDRTPRARRVGRAPRHRQLRGPQTRKRHEVAPSTPGARTAGTSTTRPPPRRG